MFATAHPEPFDQTVDAALFMGPGRASVKGGRVYVANTTLGHCPRSAP